MDDRKEKLRRQAVVSLLSAGATAAALGFLIFQGALMGRPTASMAILVALGLLVIILLAIGINLLRTARQEREGEAIPRADYRHTYRLFGLLALAAIGALVARTLLVPDSFGEDGYFRGAAPGELAVGDPRHVGEAKCAACHAPKAQALDKDVHFAVQCETCHGAGYLHATEPGKNPLLVPKSKGYCLECHRVLSARPSFFPQIEWREHYASFGVTDESIDCIRCHDPHQPLFMDRDIHTARLHPLIHRCKDCHIGRKDQGEARPADHPAIFECGTCHKDVVADFADRPHHQVACTTCHLFIKESDFAGRIIRDADPRFCLLCHRQAEFRASDKAPPSIEWPGHLAEVGNGPEDEGSRCIDCHRDRIHKPRGPADGT